MPLPTSNPGALITTVGGIPSCRIAFLTILPPKRKRPVLSYNFNLQLIGTATSGPA